MDGVEHVSEHTHARIRVRSRQGDAHLYIPSTDRYLKAIDRFHEWNVSAWITPGGEHSAISGRRYVLMLYAGIGMKLVLLWDAKNDDGIRLFLHESWEAYAKVNQLRLSTFEQPLTDILDLFQVCVKPFLRAECASQEQVLRCKDSSERKETPIKHASHIRTQEASNWHHASRLQG